MNPTHYESFRILLAGDKFVPEMHVRQPGFTNSAIGHSLKAKKD